MENKDPTITGLIGHTVQFEDPNVKDAIVEDAKQLGIHFQIDLKQEESFLTYDHWYDETKGPLTKRKLARKFAKAWNPLQEMGPITNPAKVSLSYAWKVQKFLMKRLEQAKYDFKNKGNYNPFANRKDQTKATDWSTLRKQWPSVN